MFCWAWREVEDSSRSKDKRRGAMVHLICGSVLTYDGKLIASWFLESSLTWLDTPLVIVTIMWCNSRQLWTRQSRQLAAPRASVLVLLLAGRIVIWLWMFESVPLSYSSGQAELSTCLQVLQWKRQIFSSRLHWRLREGRCTITISGLKLFSLPEMLPVILQFFRTVIIFSEQYLLPVPFMPAD